jgi:hypothetical protein
MRLRHADNIDHQRHSEDRAAATDQAEREADQCARSQAERPLHHSHHERLILIFSSEHDLSKKSVSTCSDHARNGVTIMTFPARLHAAGITNPPAGKTLS